MSRNAVKLANKQGNVIATEEDVEIIKIIVLKILILSLKLLLRSAIRPSIKQKCAKIGLSLMAHSAAMAKSASLLMDSMRLSSLRSHFIINTSPKNVCSFTVFTFVLTE